MNLGIEQNSVTRGNPMAEFDLLELPAANCGVG